MRDFIAVHQRSVQTVVRVQAISHYSEQNDQTTICFVGSDEAITVRESLVEIADMIGADNA